MKCYTFCFSFGFGEEVPRFEEGAYVNYEQAFQHLCELNDPLIKEDIFRHGIFEEGYSMDSCPPTNEIMTRAIEEGDWETYDKELKKHICYDTEVICKSIVEKSYLPDGLYGMYEIELK